MNDNLMYFGLGFVTATVGVFVVAKVLKPQIVNIAATSTTESLVRFLQVRNFDMNTLGVNPDAIKNQLIAPAIDSALTRVWL
jgi:hypothetical protein